MASSPKQEFQEPIVEANGTALTGGVTNREKITTDADQGPLLCWGSIFAGLFVLIATSWLLYLLGFALGLSIADATDGDAIGRGLGIGAIVWILISSLIAYFLGSLLASRLSGKTDNTVGMFHGLTLWGLATTMFVVFSYMGIANLLQTGAQIVSTTVSEAVGAGQTVASTADTELADSIQARLKKRAISEVSRAAADGSGDVDVTTQEVETAISQLTPETMQKVALRMAQGKTQSASDVLSANTNLTSRQVNAIIDGVQEDVSGTIERYQDEASEAVETASAYAQAVLWSVFLASAMGLAISLLGGAVGTVSTRTFEVNRRQKVV